MTYLSPWRQARSNISEDWDGQRQRPDIRGIRATIARHDPFRALAANALDPVGGYATCDHGTGGRAIPACMLCANSLSARHDQSDPFEGSRL